MANGKPHEVEPGTTVGDFIRARGLDPHHVVVEHNGEALERRRYEELVLSEGDRLELVRAVAGGARLGGAGLVPASLARPGPGTSPGPPSEAP